MRRIITKKCVDCTNEKSLDQFYYEIRPKSGEKYYNPRCKSCCKAKASARWGNLSVEDKKEKYRKDLQRALDSKRTWRREHPLQSLYTSAKCRAKSRGIPFNIDLDDLIVPEFCPYLGVRIRLAVSEDKTSYDSASVDRIDSSKGYVKGNVQIISHLANRMKNNATIEQLREFSKNVLKIHG